MRILSIPNQTVDEMHMKHVFNFRCFIHIGLNDMALIHAQIMSLMVGNLLIYCCHDSIKRSWRMSKCHLQTWKWQAVGLISRCIWSARSCLCKGQYRDMDTEGYHQGFLVLRRIYIKVKCNTIAFIRGSSHLRAEYLCKPMINVSKTKVSSTVFTVVLVYGEQLSTLTTPI